MEYENFVMIPKRGDAAKTFEPLQVEGGYGVFRILENLADLTKESNDPLEKVYEKDMLLALKSPAGTKITIEPKFISRIFAHISRKNIIIFFTIPAVNF